MACFSDTASSEALEAEIAYFYGAENPQEIIAHYIRDLKSLEKGLIGDTLRHLQAAYKAVTHEASLIFDVVVAAQIEQELILAQKNQSSFERIEEIHQRLYGTIFSVDNIYMYKASKLRTFLYQYKISLLHNQSAYSAGGCIIMRALVKESERLLSLCTEQSN